MHYKATQLHSTRAQKFQSSSTCLRHVRHHLCRFLVSINYSVIWHTQNSKYISGEKARWVKWGHSIIQTREGRLWIDSSTILMQNYNSLQDTTTSILLIESPSINITYKLDRNKVYYLKSVIIYYILFFTEISHWDKRDFWPFLCTDSPVSSMSYMLGFNRLWFWTHIYNTVQQLFRARLLQ